MVRGYCDAITDESFAELVRTLGHELLVYLTRRARGQRELAVEYLQETFRVAWERRGRFRGGNARAWLYTIARNVSSGGGGRPPGTGGPEEELVLGALGALGPMEELEPVERERLAGCLEKLGQERGTELFLVQVRYGLGSDDDGDEEGPTYADVAEQLRCLRGESLEANTVRMRISRALEWLRRCLEREATRDASRGQRLLGRELGS